jgi:tRNA-dihydrouridine synthase B
VQIFGSNPQHFIGAAEIISHQIKPHGIDINFGCPVGKIIKQGAGADLMKDLKRSREVIKAVLANTTLPVSVKLRLQAGQVTFIDFLKNISDLPVAAVMIHGRSLSQGFVGEPDFSSIKAAREYFTGPILANGGINSSR